MHKTTLLERWTLCSKQKGDRRAPKLYAVPTSSIEESIFVFEEDPGLKEDMQHPHIWMMQDRISQWPSIFMSTILREHCKPGHANKRKRKAPDNNSHDR